MNPLNAPTLFRNGRRKPAGTNQFVSSTQQPYRPPARADAYKKLVLLSFLLTTSCTVGPTYKEPVNQLDDTWAALADPPYMDSLATTQPLFASNLRKSKPTRRATPVVEWWRGFNDPHLDSLIDRAVRGNINLQIAQSRVREARYQRAIITGQQLPTVNATASYEHTRISQNGIPLPTGGGDTAQSNAVTNPRVRTLAVGGTGSTGTSAGTGAAASGGASSGGLGFGPDLDLYQAGFDASWELDVFGGIRRNVEAADADVSAAVESRRDVTVSLLAEVARNYLELRGYQRQLELGRRTLSAQEETLGVVKEKSAVGLTTDLDSLRAASEVSSTASKLPALAASEKAAMHRLATLLGLTPSELQEELSDDAPIPAEPLEIPVGLPSELLRRRPDIRHAEQNLHAATARTGAATADLYPRFLLNASIAQQSLQPKHLFDSNSFTYSVGPSVSWPLFDAGRIRNNINVQNERQEQALLQYRQTILDALREVEDALTSYAADQSRRTSLDQSTQADRLSLKLALEQYQQGTTDFLTVLDAQRTFFESEQNLADADQRVATDLVALYKALGGGWELEQK